MKHRTLALLLALTMCLGLLAACGDTAPAPAESVQETQESVQEAPPAESVQETEPPAESAEKPVEEPPAASAEEPAEESAEEPAEESIEKPAEPQTVTITFSDGQTFEATVGEDFVFFFQCNAPGDMGQPAEGEEGAGITVSDGTVTYDHVGLGGPYQYPTSEQVTISGFTGDVEGTICEEAAFMDATYTIYTDPQDIEDAIAFADYMAAQQAANPMPGEAPPPAG